MWNPKAHVSFNLRKVPNHVTSEKATKRKRNISPRWFASLLLLSLLPGTAIAQLPVTNSSVFEGNSGTRNIEFTISKALLPRRVAVTGRFSTSAFGAANPATAGNACGGTVDYIRRTGTPFSIPADVTSTTISVAVCGDSAIEPDERFAVLVEAEQCNTDTCFGIGTIFNNDGPPRITINNISPREPFFRRESSIASFNVSLNFQTPVATTVNFATANGTAVGGSVCAPSIPTGAFPDYAITSGTLTIPPNTLSRTINVSICGDQLRDPNETFVMQLTGPVNATILDGTGQATIQDATPGLPRLPP